jgi:hypothetical protein
LRFYKSGIEGRQWTNTAIDTRFKQTNTSQSEDRSRIRNIVDPCPPIPVPCLFGDRRPGGHSEGCSTRSHPELGREIPPRPWYCVLRRGRVGRRQAFYPRRNTALMQRAPRAVAHQKTQNPLHNARHPRTRTPAHRHTLRAGKNLFTRGGAAR